MKSRPRRVSKICNQDKIWRGRCTEWEIGPDSESVTPKRTYLPFIGNPSGDSEETVDYDED